MKLRILSTFIFLLCSLAAVSQVIKGTVKTQTGAPVPSATVAVLNGTQATASDKEGKFTLKLADGDYQLSISAMGFATQVKTVNISSKATINLSVQLSSVEKQLNELVVSAEKKQQDVQDVPASVTVLDAKQIRDYRLWDVTNLTALAPNLFTIEHGNSTGANFINIRGVMGFSNEQAVATYVDGVYQFDYFSAPILFNDIQSIEILRGPQGTLYGRNAFGGVINITTKQPGNTPYGYAEVTYGNYGEQRYTLSLAAPVIKDKLFASTSFTYNHKDPVCGMALTGFADTVHYKGKIIGFCSARCKNGFLSNPTAYELHMR